MVVVEVRAGGRGVGEPEPAVGGPFESADDAVALAWSLEEWRGARETAVIVNHEHAFAERGATVVVGVTVERDAVIAVCDRLPGERSAQPVRLESERRDEPRTGHEQPDAKARGHEQKPGLALDEERSLPGEAERVAWRTPLDDSARVDDRDVLRSMPERLDRDRAPSGREAERSGPLLAAQEPSGLGAARSPDNYRARRAYRDQRDASRPRAGTLPDTDKALGNVRGWEARTDRIAPRARAQLALRLRACDRARPGRQHSNRQGNDEEPQTGFLEPILRLPRRSRACFRWRAPGLALTSTNAWNARRPIRNGTLYAHP